MTTSPGDDRAERPPGLRSAVRRAAVVVALQGLVLVGLGVAYAVLGLTGDAESRLGALVGAALIVTAGVLLVLVARALDRERPWSRAPVISVQLLTLLTALSLMPTGVGPAALAAMGLAIVVLYALATQEARDALRRG